MNNAAHTPGPWTVQELEQGKNGYENWNTYCVRDAKTNVHIATVGDVDRYFESSNEKHAHLIAAAPAMYEALRELIAEHDELGMNDTGGILIARQALSQATGQTIGTR